MQITKLGYQKLGLNSRDLKYKTDPEFFKDFLSFNPSIDGLKKAVSSRKTFQTDRTLLYQEIHHQYQAIAKGDKLIKNVDLLHEENTFTIITAHQPSLFTGPLFFVYKAFSVINLTEKMKYEMPEFNFVPVFIMGSEDHDFDEINHFTLFSKSIQWNNFKGGAVGRYDVTDLTEVLVQTKEILGENSKANPILSELEKFIAESHTYNDFNFKLLNYLFGSYGMLIVNMDNVNFKKAFIPILKKEIFEEISHQSVKNTQEQLINLGFEPQAHAREINVFYLGQNFRERIIRNGECYEILNTNIKFTKNELENEIQTNPQNFSPNVILRPIYQELIFPNIAYVGGGGELAYWMERKAQFEKFNIFYPTLIRRDSVMIIPKSIQNQINKTGLKLEIFSQNTDSIVNQYLKLNSSDILEFGEEYRKLDELFIGLKNKATHADPSFESLIEAEKVKTIKQIEQIESRIKREIKKKEETTINQIANIKNKLYPNNGLQERTDNFLQYYHIMGEEFFNILHTELNPLADEAVVILEQ